MNRYLAYFLNLAHFSAKTKIGANIFPFAIGYIARQLNEGHSNAVLGIAVSFLLCKMSCKAAL